jgi:methionyl-tRNA synthetase
VVHDYLTVDGRKISKSSGVAADPADLVARYGTDAVRWWLLREVPPVGDVDFTEARLVARANEDLANGVGNLVNRVVTMVHRYRSGVVARGVVASPVAAVDAALDRFDFRGAASAVGTIVSEANRYVERARPWELAGAELDVALGVLVAACRTLAVELAPFLPGLAGRVAAQVEGAVLPRPAPVFGRLSLPS